MPKYKRILLKLSGEALSTGADGILNFDFIAKVAEKIKECADKGAQIAIVVGGGNIWRGKTGTQITRSRSDHIGMLATTINSLAMQTGLENAGLPAVTMTAIPMIQIAEPYVRDKAVEHLENGKAVIVACGTGSPFFSTDTAAVLRAVELDADAALFAKNIDGVYTADPKKDPNAKKLDTVSYNDILKNDLAVIDSTAAAMGRENDLPILLFGLNDPENIVKAVMGEKLGTIVSNY
ncbi:MAG: UMP kinase [Clostridia bacterium]|jgi:uridylate kinase|nr:UMP kinase [Clostridia bacterium]